jgi:hypothetical protein
MPGITENDSSDFRYLDPSQLLQPAYSSPRKFAIHSAVLLKPPKV